MSDIQAELAVRKRIGQLEQDMRRADQRATDACTEVRRAITAGENVAALDLDAVDAALVDLRVAKSQYQAAAKEAAELRRALGGL